MKFSYLLQVRQTDVHRGSWRVYAKKKKKTKNKKKKRKMSRQPPDVTGRYSRTETDKDITTNLGSSARQQHVPFRPVEPALDYSLQFTQKNQPSAPEPDVEQKTPRSDTHRSCSPVRFFLPCRLIAEKASPAQIGVVNPLCVSYLV